MPAVPAAPVPAPLPPAWPHAELHDRVRSALFGLPATFESDLFITGVPVGDLQNFNTSLGATIEGQTVDALNALRAAWDPDAQYSNYRFVRQAQRFPDVILRSLDPTAAEPIIMGIELKGWYALAKEGEPTFSASCATPAACQPQDLLAVYPWCLHAVVSGRPRVFDPFVVEARYAAEYRNYHWQHLMQGAIADRTINLSAVTTAYPEKAEEVSDDAAHDAGSNFGRFSRTGLMDPFNEALSAEQLAGIPIGEWRKFFKKFAA